MSEEKKHQNSPLLLKKQSSENDDVENDPNTIGFLTYNMFMRPPPAKTNATDFKDARLELFAKDYLKNYDIIAF